MTKLILNRYERTESGAFIIDVAASRIADLYENIDRRSPFLKKDLDPHLADYLIEGAQEVAEKPFVIRITLGEAHDDELKDRISHSIANYFTYMAESERRDMRAMARTSVLMLVAGLGFLVLAAYMSIWIGRSQGAWAHVFPEGITVAGWVSLWHACGTFLIQWAPRRRNVKLYHRLATAEVWIVSAEQGV